MTKRRRHRKPRGVDGITSRPVTLVPGDLVDKQESVSIDPPAPKRERVSISLQQGAGQLALHPTACHRGDVRRHLIGLTGLNALQVAWCDPAKWIVSRGKLTDSSARLAS